MTYEKPNRKSSLIQVLVASLGLLLATSVSAEDKIKTSTTDETTTDSASEKDTKHYSKQHCSSCTKRYRLGTFYVAGGAAFLDMDALNNRLDRNGYSKWETPSVPLGLGFTMRAGRFVTGAQIDRLLSSSFEAQNDEFRMDVKSWYWNLNYGYDVVKWNGLSVYPLIGIGAGHTDIWLSREEGTSFDNALANPGQGTHMKQTSLVLKASLGIDYRFKVKETEKKTSYFTIGIKGGYLFSPYNSDWSTSSAEVHSGPSRGLNGPDVQLVLGFSRQYHR